MNIVVIGFSFNRPEPETLGFILNASEIGAPQKLKKKDLSRYQPGHSRVSKKSNIPDRLRTYRMVFHHGNKLEQLDEKIPRK